MNDETRIPCSRTCGPAASASAPPFERLLALVEKSGRPYRVRVHAPTRTMRDARDTLGLDPRRIIKTIAFRTRPGRLALAALRGARRVDYAKFAALLGVSRRDVFPLSPPEVLQDLGVAPGGVSPPPLVAAETFLDEDALAIAPTAYCGLGRPDRTLGMAPADLLALCGGKSGSFGKE